eukprot:gene11764-biopygen9443
MAAGPLSNHGSRPAEQSYGSRPAEQSYGSRPAEQSYGSRPAEQSYGSRPQLRRAPVVQRRRPGHPHKNASRPRGAGVTGHMPAPRPRQCPVTLAARPAGARRRRSAAARGAPGAAAAPRGGQGWNRFDPRS